MSMSEAAGRRWATVTFAGICTSYALDGAVPVLGVLSSGHAWTNTIDVVHTAQVLMTFTFPLVGYLIARQQPRNAVGWVMLAIGAVYALPTAPYIEYGTQIRPGSLPGVTVVAALTAARWAPFMGLVGTFLILLFPDGHVPGPRWRPVAWLSGLVVTWVYLLVTLTPGELVGAGVGNVQNPLGLSVLSHELSFLQGSILLLPLIMLLCAAGLVVRFRHSTGAERRQLKWLAASGTFVAAMYALALVASLRGNWSSSDPTWLRVIENVVVLSFALIPVSIGVAILKHGLYDVDVVINKTVVFGLLVAFITVVYVTIVVGVGRVASRGDQPNILLSIAATTVVAVAFQPVRERVQRFADHLVYGRRATPYEVLAEFADRLGGAYVAGELLPTMVRTVAEGVGASRVEVWLATASGLVREAAWPEHDADETSSLATSSGIGGDAVVEVRQRGELLGVLSVTKPPGESLRPAELRLLDAVAAQAGLVLRNVRLVEELRGSRGRLMTGQDDARRRIERRLHNGAQRRLSEVAMTIAAAKEQIGPDAGATGPVLDQLAAQLRAATEELGELARGIHPAMLTDFGLEPALGALAERAPVPVRVDVHVDGQLHQNVEATLYFVVAEALTNVAKYAHATSVVVALRVDDGTLVLDVTDDGIGGVDESRGSGVQGLRDRVAAVDGAVEVNSPPGGGTHLRCVVPLSGARRTRSRVALAVRSA